MPISVVYFAGDMVMLTLTPCVGILAPVTGARLQQLPPYHAGAKVHRKSLKKGFEFTLLIVRESRLGKLNLNYSMMLSHSFGYCVDGTGLRASLRPFNSHVLLPIRNVQYHNPKSMPKDCFANHTSPIDVLTDSHLPAKTHIKTLREICGGNRYAGRDWR